MNSFILAARSSVFKRMILSEDMEEARNKEIPITGSTDDVFLEFAKYIVSGKTPEVPDCEQQMDLYRLAHLSVVVASVTAIRNQCSNSIVCVDVHRRAVVVLLPTWHTGTIDWVQGVPSPQKCGLNFGRTSHFAAIFWRTSHFNMQS